MSFAQLDTEMGCTLDNAEQKARDNSGLMAMTKQLVSYTQCAEDLFYSEHLVLK